MLPFGRALGAALAICALTAFSVASARASGPSYDATRAAFVLLVSKYVTWPAAAFSSPSAPIVVAVIGNPALAAKLRTLASSQLVEERPFEIRSAANAASCAGAHIVFVSEAEQAPLLDADSAPLRVSEEPDELRETDIAIRVISGRVAFAVNRKDVQRRGLKLSSKLMRLASSFE